MSGTSREARRLGLGTLVVLAALVVACGSGGGTVATKAARWFAGALEDSQALKILGQSATRSEIDDLIAATKSAQKAGLTILLPVAGRTLAAAFADDIAKFSNQVVTVTGHNSNGLLMFGDGTSLHVKDLAAMNRSVKIGVISCSSGRLLNGTAAGLPTDVASNVAALTEAKFNSAASGYAGDVTVARLQEIMESSFAAAKQETANAEKVTYLKYTAGAGAGFGAIAMISIYTKK